MQIHTETETDSYPTNNTLSNYHALITLEAPETDGDNDDNIVSKFVILVDISSSMYGPKIEIVRQTLETIVKYMKTTDYLSIVLYNSNVEVLTPLKQMTNNAKEFVIEDIKNIKTKGYTDIGKALVKADEIIGQSSHINADTTSVFLMTDGIITKGEKEPHIISDMLTCDYKIHSFGIGNDHAVDFLKVITESRDGSYYFIEKSEEIKTAFGNCIGGILNTYAKDIQIRIEPTPGREINKIKTYFNVVDADGIYTVHIPDIQEGEKRDILIDFELYGGPDTNVQYSEVLFSLLINYHNIKDGTSHGVNYHMSLNRTNDNENIMMYNTNVSKQINRYLTSEAIKEARDMADNGGFKEARAYIEDVINRIKSSCSGNEEYCQYLIKDLEKCAKIVENISSYSKVGKYYMTTTMTSHGLQRSNDTAGLSTPYSTRGQLGLSAAYNDDSGHSSENIDCSSNSELFDLVVDI
jgi:uncharacterized protein YegL